MVFLGKPIKLKEALTLLLGTKMVLLEIGIQFKEVKMALWVIKTKL